jgi:hypothetical protein
MAEQARDLTKMMERFQVGESGSAGRVAAPAAAPAARPERRSANRPFAGKPRTAAKQVAAVAIEATRGKAVANGGDADWREF